MAQFRIVLSTYAFLRNVYKSFENHYIQTDNIIINPIIQLSYYPTILLTY